MSENHIRPILQALPDTDGIGLKTALDRVYQYYAEDYPIMTPRFIKMACIVGGYANGLNSSTSETA